jgi:hypothetical protein
LGDVLSNGELDMPATNGGIYNLARCLAENHQSLRNVRCVLISPFGLKYEGPMPFTEPATDIYEEEEA